MFRKNRDPPATVVDRRGSDAAPVRFNFAINRLFCRISGSLRTEPLRRFLRYQFGLTETQHTFISFNYDLALDLSIQREGKDRWNVQKGYGFPIRYGIRPDEGLQHMQQFKSDGAFSLLHATQLNEPQRDCS